MSGRRGSALLIVIGTLALIAVFAAVYISIGRTDRRSARAVLARKDAVDTSTALSEYLAGVIATDRLETMIQYGDIGAAGSSGYGVRENTDAPYTDWTRRSASNIGTLEELFLPSGKLFAAGNGTGNTDFRVASDPWLASTTPVFLGDPGVMNANRPFSQFESFDPKFPNAKNFLDNRDWLQISNFAPDGRFVNLFNLRPNRATGYSTPTVGESEVGGFYAEPGVGSSLGANGRQIRRMSNYLSLWNLAIPGDPETLIQTYDPMDNGDMVWVPGSTTPLPIGVSDLWNIPAVWTMNQRFMFMPMNQPFITNNRNGLISTWADPDFPAYQYADADGDGMADSRWIELVAARDRSEDTNTTPRIDIESLYNNKDYRYFIAARAVDLSSMVNVNTATDLLVPPTIAYPMGLTPADVDLRRLLTMQDPAGDYIYAPQLATTKQPLSYGLLHRPYAGPNDTVVGQWDPTLPSQAGFAQNHFNRDVEDYWVYRHQSTNDPRALVDNSNSMLIGRFAYDALRQGITLGNSLRADYLGYASTNPVPPTPSSRQLREFERSPNDFNASPVQITPQQRYEQYRNIDGINPASRAVAWSQSTTFGSGLYGLDDLSELLSYHGLNDPEVTTRLERVTTGRYQSQAAGGFPDVVQAKRLGPLMSNRSLTLDRDQHGIALINIAGDPSAAPSSQNLTLRKVNGRISFNSMAHFALTPRNKLTTISGAVPFRPTDIFADPLNPANPYDPSIEQALTATLTAAPSLSSVISDANALYTLYSNALDGAVYTPKPNNFMSSSSNWPATVASFEGQSTSTLFYGHRGPELGLRIAAHAAVNMKDIADSDGDPTVATLVLDNGEGARLRTFVQTNNANVMSDAEYSLYPGLADGNLFDPGVVNLASGNLPSKRQVVNVFGLEATPVLTEVSVMYIYNDAPEGQGELGSVGDADYSTTGLPRFINNQIFYNPAAMQTNITISNTFARNNPDFLGQVLAFQLHNPYDQAISLGGTNYKGQALAQNAALTKHVDPLNQNLIDPTSNYLFDYYIEYAGRFFKIAKYIEWYPTTRNPENYFTVDRSDPVIAALGDNPANSVDPLMGRVMMPGTRASTDAPGSQAPNSNFITRNVVLQPGQTRVFYVIADRRFDDEGSGVVGRDQIWEKLLDFKGRLPNRFKSGVASDGDFDTLPDGGDGRGWTGPAEEWIEHQFRVSGNTVGARPVMMCEFDPRNGQLVNEGSAAFVDLTTPSTSILGDPTREDITEVRLWKKIVTRGEETTDVAANIDGVSTVTSENLVSNDMLVDRIRVGAGMNIALPNSGGIAQTWGYPENFPDMSTPQGRALAAAGVRSDNSGVVIARWKTVRRADSTTLNKPAIGQVTPWMLRSRNGTSVTRIEDDNLVLAGHTASDIFDGNGNFNSEASSATIKGDYEIQKDMRAFFDLYWVRGAGAGAIIQTIALEPHLKSNVSVSTGLGNANEDDTLNNSAGKFTSAPLTSLGTAANLIPGAIASGVPVPEVLVDGSNIKSKPRLGDLLMAWGIGTTYAPDPTRGANSPMYVEEEWMTTSEAMAVALGYDNPAAAAIDEADSVWRNAYGQGTSKKLLDDGHLVLDDFVSYYNVTIESPAAFSALSDIPRGTGVPMALGVIDQARAVSRIPLANDPTGSLSAREQLELALARPTMGTVNINTAPIEVLRLLPGLTPSRQQYTGGATTREWWGAELTDTNLPNIMRATTTAMLLENPDVAAAIIAYRDRTYGVPNTAAMSDAATSGTQYGTAPLSFEPTNVNAVPNNMRTEVPLVGPTTGARRLDRSTMTGIDGLRQTPGFGSLGELMAVRVDPGFASTDTARWDRTRHLSIDQYGQDKKYSGRSGQTTIMSQLFGGTNPGTTTDDYAEKLAMANGVLGTLSVRSDFYAVWFVVQGYQESDVANLRPEDPLVPTIRKRYLMVIDRSNVIEPGDQPEVLLFKELPI